MDYQELRKQEALERIQVRRSLCQPPASPLQVFKPNRFAPPTPRQIEKVCEVCLNPYNIQRSHANRRRSCGERECVAEVRSRVNKQRNPDWKRVRACSRPGCTAELKAGRQHTRQVKYCSNRCAALGRSRTNPTQDKTSSDTHEGNQTSSARHA